MKQTLQIFINDHSVDLLDQTPPAYTLQVNTFDNFTSQKGNFTKQIQLPLTKRNRLIFRFPDSVNFNTGKVYKQLPAKLVQNGVEIIPNGICEVSSVQNNLININIFAGTLDFVDELGGQLYDMGDSTTQWSGFGQNKVWDQYSIPFPNDPDNIDNCVWDVAHMAYSQQKTSGWIWPVIDYGSVGFPDYSGPINVRMQRPAFFVHTVFELLVQSAGYKIDYDRSGLMRDQLFQKLLIPFANDSFQHGLDYQNAPPIGGFNTIKSIQQGVNKGGPASGNINFDGVNLWDGYNYYATENITGTVTLIFEMFLQGIIGTTNPSQVKISINVRNLDGSNTNYPLTIGFANDWVKVDGDGASKVVKEIFTNQKISTQVSLVAGMAINVNFQTQNSQNTQWIMSAGATLSFVPDEQDVLFGQPIQCEMIMPDISELDFLKDIMQHFGVICQANNVTKKVIFALFGDIVKNKPIALDWSLKCVDQGMEITYQLGNYSQINWLRYTFDDDDNLKLLLPQYFADDHIDINNTTLNPNQIQADLFVSNFSPSINRAYYGGSIAQILKIDTESSLTDFSISTVARLMVDQKYALKQAADGSGESVTFTSTDGGGGPDDVKITDVISIPYFYKPDGKYNLCYCDKGGQPGFKTSYYKDYQNVLKDSKLVTRYFMLTPLDVANLDFLIPIYLMQDNSYYYISKIDSWVKGQPCKVDLIRL